MGALVGALIVTHTPRMADEDNAPAFTREMIRGMHELREVIRLWNPDALVQISTHWVTTFHHYVLGHRQHEGILTSSEAPDMICGAPYSFPGEPDLAGAIVAGAKNTQVPAILSAADHFVLDYGTVNPLRYLTPNFDVPVVPLSCCLMGSLEECIRWGEIIAQEVERSSKRVVFIASGALSHILVRGPERWPTKVCQKLDHEFIDLVTQGKAKELKTFFPPFVKKVQAEMGGRHLAALLGATGGKFRGKLHAYGPSSGTGNAVVSLAPV